MRLLSVKEAAERLAVTPRRIRALLDEGRFPGAYKVGWSWAIPEQAVEEFAPLPPFRPKKGEE